LNATNRWCRYPPLYDQSRLGQSRSAQGEAPNSLDHAHRGHRPPTRHHPPPLNNFPNSAPSAVPAPCYLESKGPFHVNQYSNPHAHFAPRHRQPRQPFHWPSRRNRPAPLRAHQRPHQPNRRLPSEDPAAPAPNSYRDPARPRTRRHRLATQPHPAARSRPPRLRRQPAHRASRHLI
jgi:hypothetical protein